MDKQTLEQLQAVTDPAGLIVALELTCDAFDAPIRLVNDVADRVINGISYTAMPFYFKLPDRQADQMPKAQLAIDNVGRYMSEALESIQPNQTLMARIVVYTNTDAPSQVYRCWVPVSNISVNQVLATADCSVGYLLSQKAVKLRATPDNAPGIF